MSPTAAGSRIRAAIVGAGLMGRWHADALARVGGELAWVIDVDARRAALLGQRYPGARVGEDLATALGQVDVVHVCAPLASHAATARRALEAHCHVLVEKPLAETAAATADLLELAAERNRLLNPVHQFLFQAGMRRALASLDQIAPLLHVDSLACSAGAETGTFAVNPDGLIAEIVPHPLALLARLFPGSLSDVTWHTLHPRPGELRASTTIGATSVSLLVSAAGRPTANTLRLIGANGTIEVDLFHGFGVLERGGVSRLRKIAHPFVRSGTTLLAAGANLAERAVRREPAYPGLRTLIAEFYAAVLGSHAPPIPPNETLDVAIARDALVTALGRHGQSQPNDNHGLTRTTSMTSDATGGC